MLWPNRPALDLDALQIEAEQRAFGRLHGRGLVMFVLAQEQEVLADLVLAERGRIALEMLGQFADVANVLLFGGRPIIFKLDQLLELCDRRIGVFHRWERMPSCEDRTAHQIFSNDAEPKDAPTPLQRSGSTRAAANAGERLQFRCAVHVHRPGVAELSLDH